VQPPVLERRLAAILSADAVGYSRLMADDQAATVRTITSYRGLIASLIGEHRGRVVDAPGDNVLAEFPTALDAVEAAVEIQRVLHARNLGLPENRHMRFRVGVHLGDVTVESGRVYGDGVNVAARIEALAEPGGICVSGPVQEQLRQHGHLACEDLGDRTLKNIPDPVRVFRVRFDGLAPVPKAPVFEPPAPKQRLRAVSLAPWVLVVVLAMAIAFQLHRRESAHVDPSARVSRWTVALPAGSRLGLPGAGGRFDYSRLVAVSADGSRIAYTVQDKMKRSELHVREIDAVEARPIPGTVNARAPFFSPEGNWVGFLADNTIQKVALAGGSPQKICKVDRVVSFDASWAPDGETVVYATDDGLWRVPAAGGTPEQLTKPDAERGEVGHHSPRHTADGRGVLFTVSVTPETHLALLSLDTGTWEILLEDASAGVEIAGDRLVFARSGELLAAPYDPESGRIAGSPESVLQDVHTSPGLGGVVLTHFDVAGTGTLAYVPAAAAAVSDELLWVDHEGNESAIIAGPGTWVHPRLSPDGQRISLDIHSPDGMRDVYIYEIPRGQLRQLTGTGITWESEWRPDGQRLAIMSGAPAGFWSVFWTRTDFSAPPELLFRSSHAVPTDWLPNGQSLLFYDLVEEGIWRLSPEGGGKPELVIRTGARERFPSVSPDGKWIAYVADESGRREVVSRPRSQAQDLDRRRRRTPVVPRRPPTVLPGTRPDVRRRPRLRTGLHRWSPTSAVHKRS
jgi:class 3 adenylate cyclase/Tol biopolymer transport system component